MSERIRYALGSSSLGDFVAAASDDGLVAFEFGEQGTAMLDRLRMRFPDATIVDDRSGLSDIVGKLEHLVDHPDQDPGIVLDMRGSDYQKQVWTMLREVPAGETTNYGSLAAKLGTRDARDVTEAIGSNAIAILIPCHRVVKKDGSISGYRWGVCRKRILLQRERRTEHLPGSVKLPWTSPSRRKILSAALARTACMGLAPSPLRANIRLADRSSVPLIPKGTTHLGPTSGRHWWTGTGLGRCAEGGWATPMRASVRERIGLCRISPKALVI